MKKFKNDFIFSTSTCAYQVEGGRQLGGRKLSNWDKFTIDNHHIPLPGKAEREIASIDVASDYYHRYEQDSKIMKKIGVNGFVYNMDWARIFPDNAYEINEEGLQWYENMFKSLVNNGVEPIPILYHWDTPLWLEQQGGTSGDQFVSAFKNFSKVLFERLGKYSKHWFVNDENSSYTTSAYLDDYNPPQKNNPEEFWQALHNLNMSGAAAMEEFKIAKKNNFISHDSILGIDHDWNPGIPYDEKDEDDKNAVKIFNEYNLDLFLNPNMLGTYPECFYQETEKLNIYPIKDGDLDYLKENLLEFIGWNYYRPAIIAHPKRKKENIDWFIKPSNFITDKAYIVFPKNQKYTKWNWLIKPEDLVSGSKTLFKKYNAPLMIVENGIGYFDKRANGIVHDDYRIDYLNEHLRMVQKAIDEGVPFIGYSLWTYCDIFSPSGGYRKKYGLVGVDFEKGTLNRFPKTSYMWYKKVIENKDTYETLEIPYSQLEKETIEEYQRHDIWNQNK